MLLYLLLNPAYFQYLMSWNPFIFDSCCQASESSWFGNNAYHCMSNRQDRCIYPGSPHPGSFCQPVWTSWCPVLSIPLAFSWGMGHEPWRVRDEGTVRSGTSIHANQGMNLHYETKYFYHRKWSHMWFHRHLLIAEVFV